MRARRLTLLACALPACTLLNPLDPGLLDADAGCVPCLERSVDTCTNEQDDDQDGLVDCKDPDCVNVFECFESIEYVRGPRCPATRAAFLLVDDFDDFDTNAWVDFGSGIATKSKFGIGSEQGFDALIVLENEGQCENTETEQRCTFAIDFHTREDWTTGALDGESIFGVSIVAMKDHGRFEVRCAYHQRSLDGSAIHIIDTDLSNRMTFDIESSLSGRIELRYAGETLCTTPVIQALEPPLRLVFQRGGRSVGRVLIDEVRLDVREQDVSDACVGRTVGRAVIADSYCRRDFAFNKGMVRPKIAHGVDGYTLLFTGIGESGSAIWHASNDGLFDFRLKRVLGDQAFAGDRAGGLYSDFEGQRLVAYGIDGTAYRYVASKEPPNGGPPFSEWWHDQPVVVTLPEDQGPAVELPIPETILVPTKPEEKYLAWFSSPSLRAGGKRAIYAAESSDGVNFTTKPGPAFAPGGPGAWDHDGVSSPSVVYTGTHYLMAYSAKAFFGAEAIGLAASQDGEVWKRLDAPIFTGGDEGFDDGGVADPSLDGYPGRLSIWYTATTFGLRRCADPNLDTGLQTRIGFAELIAPF